ncbi:tetratricopeptide repeat protein [Thiohalocapsa sp. ML1]|jgi:tetratricopeptide (TPR) repeat protein|uniref:tetratricopeptide repeat protein n=1 Tax=Thiohalocapsa sp. ML1 TaxID=1431688 RepID=UPI000731F37D|nr:tetratricopeptide repeat protein [Thiohalocapsa sp. ML1]
MFPKLTPLQWLVFLFGLAFYGFAVFALTRDYYLRHPPQAAPAATATAPHADMGALGERMRAALGGDAGAVPAAELLATTDPARLGQEADRLFAARRFTAAVPLYRRILELDPDAVEAQNDLGLALHYAGETPAGLEVLRDGAAAAPEHQRIQLSLGFVALQAGDVDTGRQALTRARELDPGSDVGQEAARLLGLLDAEQDR